MTNIDKNTDVKIKCFKCSNEYTMDQMRMDPNGKNLTCKNCLDRKSIQEAPIGTFSLKNRAKKAEPRIAREETRMMEYFCNECKYGFRRAEEVDVKTCPYCDSKSFVSKVKGA